MCVYFNGTSSRFGLYSIDDPMYYLSTFLEITGELRKIRIFIKTSSHKADNILLMTTNNQISPLS